MDWVYATSEGAKRQRAFRCRLRAWHNPPRRIDTIFRITKGRRDTALFF